MKNKSENKMTTPKLLKRFLPYYKLHIRTLVFDLFCASLTTVCELALPMIVRYITNAVTTDISLLTPSIILGVGAAYLVMRVIDAVANYYMASVGHIMGTKMETKMRKDLHKWKKLRSMK